MVAKADVDTSTEIQRNDLVGNTLREVSRKRQSLSDLFTIVSLPHASFSWLVDYEAFANGICCLVRQRLCPDQRWIPEQPNDHGQCPSEGRIPQAVHFGRQHARV